MGYFIKRTNVTADNDVTLIGKRFMCGRDAIPYDSERSAQTALKQQKKQDAEYCPDCLIRYEIIGERL